MMDGPEIRARIMERYRCDESIYASLVPSISLTGSCPGPDRTTGQRWPRGFTSAKYYRFKTLHVAATAAEAKCARGAVEQDEVQIVKSFF